MNLASRVSHTPPVPRVPLCASRSNIPLSRGSDRAIIRYMLKVLVACEISGRVRNAFRALGADAYSCDILPSYINGVWRRDDPYHIQCDVREILDRNWDLMIAHPPCTYLCCSGLKHSACQPDKQNEAVEFVRTLLFARIPRICIENPRGILSTRLYPPTQRIHPWMFGDPYSKETCLWLRGLPALRREVRVRPILQRIRVGQVDRGLQRSITFPGIARAMASQWNIIGPVNYS